MVQPKKRVLPWIPREETIDKPAATANDLSRLVDECVAEGRKIHPQQHLLFASVFFFPATMDGKQQCRPGLKSPGQGGHDHVSPVAHQIVHWGCQCVYAVFLLFDEVFLVATVVSLEHDLLWGTLQVVGDVKETFRIVE